MKLYRTHHEVRLTLDVKTIGGFSQVYPLSTWRHFALDVSESIEGYTVINLESESDECYINRWGWIRYHDEEWHEKKMKK